MQFLFARPMFMHCHTLLFLFLFLEPFFFLLCFLFSFLLPLVSWLWHLKSLFPPRTQLDVMVLFLFPLFLILWGFVMKRPEMTSLRTSLTGWFIRNAKSLSLTFQTLLYPTGFVFRVGFLYVRYPKGVSVCSFRSFTPTCTPSIPLYLGLLRYSEVHIL